MSTILLAGTGLLSPVRAGSGTDEAPARGLLLVVNKYKHTLGIVHPEAGRQLATVPVNVTDHGVCTYPHGKTHTYPSTGTAASGFHAQTGAA